MPDQEDVVELIEALRREIAAKNAMITQLHEEAIEYIRLNQISKRECRLYVQIMKEEVRTADEDDPPNYPALRMFMFETGEYRWVECQDREMIRIFKNMYIDRLNVAAKLLAWDA